eukprot:3015495-Prymnesium_polylepis.1
MGQLLFETEEGKANIEPDAETFSKKLLLPEEKAPETAAPAPEQTPQTPQTPFRGRWPSMPSRQPSKDCAVAKQQPSTP